MRLLRQIYRVLEKNRKITQESFDEFVERVSDTMKNFPVATINNLIDSIPKRLEMVIANKGIRTKY